MKKLLSKIFNVNPNCPQRLASQLAAEITKPHPDIAKAIDLIERGASLNTLRDYFGSPLLVVAAQNGHLGIVRAMVDKGAKINARSIRGATAVIAAAQQGHADVVDYLLAKNANVTKPDCFGMTAADHAREHKHHAIADSIAKAAIAQRFLSPPAP